MNESKQDDDWVREEDGVCIFGHGKKTFGTYYKKNQVYVTRRTSTLNGKPLHWYKNGKGYPIDNWVLKKLTEFGCEMIKIIERRADNTNKIYHGTLGQYKDAVLICHPPFTGQRCVPLKQLEEYKNGG